MTTLVEDESDEDFIPDEPTSRLATMSKPLRIKVPTMKSITMKKVKRYEIIEAVL